MKQLPQHMRVLRKEKHKRIFWAEKIKTKQQMDRVRQLEKINQKLLAKERRLKR